jgi:D-alanyl-lipoteichoic acid acyltransferase DltB (MBOAT superfamily)
MAVSAGSLVAPLAATENLAAGNARLKMALFAVLGSAAGALFFYWSPQTYRPLGYVPAARFLLGACIYLCAARASLYLTHARLRMALFAIINLVSIGLFFDVTGGKRRLLFFLAAYLAMVTFHYLLMRLFAEREEWTFWVAFLSPIAALVVVRYTPFLFDPLWKAVPGILSGPLAGFFIGISYMAFRLSHLTLEVRHRVVPTPSYLEYVGFSLFLPTLVVGPINPYHAHQQSLNAPDRAVTPVGRACLRILIGSVKYQFLGNIFNQLSYSALLLDGHPHPPVDLFVAAVCYHLYLYANFSGFCDIAIGAAGLLGVHVKENFRNPLGARSVQDYWTRWHITLSEYMRDLVFSPLSKFLVIRCGATNANHAIALAILVVFLLVGIWHGVGWNYAIYGAIHAMGVGTNHYYAVWLKKRLGKERYKAYNENRWVQAVAVTATFLFVTASLFFFANDFSQMQEIFRAVQR